jgi:ribosomal protein S18 acetylase RimI-like enzyme
VFDHTAKFFLFNHVFLYRFIVFGIVIMEMDNTEIRLVNSWSIDEIVELYIAGGWWKDSYDTSLINQMIVGSFIFAVVVDTTMGKAVGMGRVISDGISDAYIQDLVVLPKYRRQGLGKKLVDFLINQCLSKGIVWIGVIAEPGSDKLYRSLGFKPMKGHIPMLYQLEE